MARPKEGSENPDSEAQNKDDKKNPLKLEFSSDFVIHIKTPTTDLPIPLSPEAQALHNQIYGIIDVEPDSFRIIEIVPETDKK